MSTLLFGGHFIASKIGKTGLVDVTIRVTRVTLSDGTLYALVTDAACAEDTAAAKGGYLYRLTGADLTTYNYIGYMSTADATVDQKCVAAMWVQVDANLLSILGAALTGTAAQIVAAFVKFFNVATPALTAESVNLPALVGGRVDASVGAVANGAITAASIATDAIDADAIKADAITEIQSGLAAATNLADLHTDVAALSLAWAASALAASVATGAISQIRGDVWDIALTGLASSTGATAIDFSIKAGDVADSAALLHIRLSIPAVPATDGLDVLNGAPSGDLAAGYITNVSATAKTIHLDADKTAQLAAATGYAYDVQYLYAATTGPATVEKGTFAIVWDVTRATS